MRAFAAALALVPALALAAAPVPPLTGPVVDAAGLLDGGSVRRLDALARAAREWKQGQGVQLQFLVVKSLDGEPIEDYSIRVAETWRIGTKGKDDGVLVTVAVEDRAVRIEVGGGLEGGLTDVQSSRIIRSAIAPAFREGRYGDGLYDAGVQILSALGSLPPEIHQTRRRGAVPGLLGSAFPILIVIFILANIFRGFGPRRRRHLWWGGGPWMGGGFGGGGGLGGGGFFGGGLGGGGGGWSGGGGGFSGGGASGRW